MWRVTAFGVVAAQEQGLWSVWTPGPDGWPKNMDFPKGAELLKGAQGKHVNINRRGPEKKSKQIIEIDKVSKIIAFVVR